MYKYIAVLLLLSCFILPVCAQNEKNDEDNENKRPSWSKGLPERQKSNDINTNEFKPEIETDVELDMSEFGLQEKPKIKIELPISEEFGVNPKSNSENVNETSKVEEAVAVEALPVETEAVIEQPAVEDSSEIDSTEAVQEIDQELPSTIDETQEPINELQDVQQVESAQSPIEIDNENTVDQEVINSSNDGVDNQENQTADLTEPLNEALDQPVESEATEINSTPENDAINDEVNQVEDAAEIEIATQVDETAYVWEIVSRTPVTYPPRAAVENLEGWVDVEVTINPAGEVVSVSPVKYSRGGRVFGKNAIKSVKEWQFKPPSSVGITTNITRIYNIEFDL